MLKITVTENASSVELKLEGRIAGPWVAEFERTWRSIAPSLDSRKLSLDLREVTYIDAAGRRLLAEIYNQTGARFETGSLMIDFVVRKAMQPDA